MKIYTKKGDDGTTSLMDGKRIRKNNLHIVACGELDELSSFIGFAISLIKNSDILDELHKIQHKLFLIGASIADVNNNTNIGIKDKDVESLEKNIDILEARLDPLKNFILPGGSQEVAILHVCRAVCRRAERALTSLGEIAKVDAIAMQYINRISDYLFISARYVAKLNNEEEEILTIID